MTDVDDIIPLESVESKPPAAEIPSQPDPAADKVLPSLAAGYVDLPQKPQTKPPSKDNQSSDEEEQEPDEKLPSLPGQARFLQKKASLHAVMLRGRSKRINSPKSTHNTADHLLSILFCATLRRQFSVLFGSQT